MLNSMIKKYDGKIIVTGPSNGTQYIAISGNRIGYINPTTRRKGALFGLRIKHPRETNGFHPSERNEVLQHLGREYGEIPEEWLYYEASKDNTYVMIKATSYAESIFSKEAGQTKFAAVDSQAATPKSGIRKRIHSTSSKSNADVPEYSGIKFNTDWNESNSIDVELLPNSPGIYVEIYWPSRGVRIGETGRSIRGKIKHDIRWFNRMHDGSAPPKELRRTLPIAEIAKQYGSKVFSFYVASQDSRLENKEIRQECERFLFQWVEENIEYRNWNFQKSWR